MNTTPIGSISVITAVAPTETVASPPPAPQRTFDFAASDLYIKALNAIRDLAPLPSVDEVIAAFRAARPGAVRRRFPVIDYDAVNPA